MARSSLKNVIRLLEENKEPLTVEQGFLDDLKRSIELDDSKNHRKSSMMYKPSSMQCIRNMYYQRSGAEEDARQFTYNFIGICNSGTDIHVRIQTAVDNMKNNGMDCEYIDVGKFVEQREIPDLTVVSNQGMETKLRHETLHLSFMCDGIIKYKNHYYILEIKTETCNKWYARKGVDPKHMDQATAYSLTLGIDKVIFIYVSRDNLDMKSYTFEVTGDMKQDLVGKITDCDGYVERGITPPKPSDVDRRVCEYCNYKSLCRKE